MSAAKRDGDRSSGDERVDHLLDHLSKAIELVDELGDWPDVAARLHEVLDTVGELRKENGPK
jgi:hypothetical protein